MPRSAREIDLDPRTYVGLSFPLRADNNNNFAMTKNSIQQSIPGKNKHIYYRS